MEENLVLGRPELRHGILDFKELRPGFERVAKDLGTQLQFEAPVSALSVGGRQQVELVRALFHEPRLLILDEPTAVLPPAERDRLLKFIRGLKGRGMATILISHKLDDLYDGCDRAVVMRGGRVVGSSDLSPDDRAQLVRLIVGAEPRRRIRDMARAARPWSRSRSWSSIETTARSRWIAAASICMPARLWGCAVWRGTGRPN